MTLQDRPTAAELLEAVREFLERDLMVRDDLPSRVRFHTRVAVNCLGIVERELTLGPELDAAERERLATLLGHDGTADDLTAELARRIRDGSLDDRRAAVVDHVRESVRAKLLVANPGYLERVR
jgi:Domain of unknown function (DUF6285)